jgi:hypothetical protein
MAVDPHRVGHQYVESLRNQPEGRTLFTKIESSTLKPSMCGYFDTVGDWHEIVDLNEDEPAQRG